MVPIKGEWTSFIDFQDQLDHYRLWGLIPEKGKQLRPVTVTDGYFGSPQPCKVVGYQTDTWAVIELEDGFHAIYGEYLAELQPDARQRLPRGMCFAEILQRYIVVDIETTGFNIHDDRIIEIAAITYEYGKKINEFHSLVNPKKRIPAEIVSLTGISQNDVDCAPTVEAVAPAFFNFIDGFPLVGHNAITFDIPFLKAQLGEFENIIIDTLPMARKVFPQFPCHKLEYLKDALALRSSTSHRALPDVETTNDLMWACLAPRKYEAKVWHAYLDGRQRTVTESTPKPRAAKPAANPMRKRFETVDIKSIVPTCDSIDNASPLCGKNIVFTGTLSIPREEAMQLAVNAGAILKSGVSKTTNYLVVGQQDKALVGSDGRSSKEEKAHALNQSGKANIQIISEKEFVKLFEREGAAL